MEAKYKLIGTPFSYYTGKVRSYLIWKGIPFEEIFSTPEVYKKIIVPRTKVRYIPVLLSPDEKDCIQDTTDIIFYLEKKFPRPTIVPQTPAQQLVSHLFEVYADEYLIIPNMHYRWNFQENVDFILPEFGALGVPEGSSKEKKLEAGIALSNFFRNSLPNLGITESSVKQIEQLWEGFLTKMENHFQHYPFLLGTRPSIGDFGLMGALFGHAYRDPYSGKLMKKIAPNVANFVERMNRNKGSETSEFLSNDTIPQSLFPVLEDMFRDHFPIYIETAHSLLELLKKRPEIQDKIPRAIGEHQFMVNGKVAETRKLFPFVIWMFQFPLCHFSNLSQPEQNNVKHLVFDHLSPSCWTTFQKALEVANEIQVERVNNQLVVKHPRFSKV